MRKLVNLQLRREREGMNACFNSLIVRLMFLTFRRLFTKLK